MNYWKSKLAFAVLAIWAVYSFGSYVLYMQTPKGQCENATDKVEWNAECYYDSSCMLERHQLYEFNKYRKIQAIYCPMVEGQK